MKLKVITTLFLFSVYCFSQEPKFHPKVEEIQQQKWQMIIEQVKLTPKEIELVEPIFLEYEKAIWAIHQQKKNFFKLVQQSDVSEKPNYAQLNEQYVELEVREAELFKKYNQQLKKVLNPATLFQYYKVEREFKRKLLEEMRKRNHFQPKNPD